MQKILQGIKQIDKINYSSRHLIDYSNLKQGILKYQNNFLRLDQVDFFYKNFCDNCVFLMPVVANMFYAGPREACHHANIREKVGFDYFLVGRVHAGANDYYKTNHAPELIKKLKKSKINIISHYGSYYDTKKKIVLSYNKNIPNNYTKFSKENLDYIKKNIEKNKNKIFRNSASAVLVSIMFPKKDSRANSITFLKRKDFSH